MLFKSIRTRNLYYLHSSPPYLNRLLRKFPNLMARTLKLCLLYMISLHIFPRIRLYSQHIADPHPQETVLFQDVDNMRDSPSSAGVTKEIAVAVKESSRSLEKRIGQRTLAKRVTSGLPPQKSIRLLVCSRLIMFPMFN